MATVIDLNDHRPVYGPRKVALDAAVRDARTNAATAAQHSTSAAEQLAAAKERAQSAPAGWTSPGGADASYVVRFVAHSAGAAQQEADLAAWQRAAVETAADYDDLAGARDSAGVVRDAMFRATDHAADAARLAGLLSW